MNVSDVLWVVIFILFIILLFFFMVLYLIFIKEKKIMVFNDYDYINIVRIIYFWNGVELVD